MNRNLTQEEKNALNTLLEKYMEHNMVTTSGEDKYLAHSFWTMQEIEDASKIQSEWNVDERLVPFYGNWHTLFCIDTSSEPHKVIEIDDNRNVIFTWESLLVFCESLKIVEEDTKSNDLGIIESKSWIGD